MPRLCMRGGGKQEGTYRIKEQLLPDVRDGPDVRDVAMAADVVKVRF